jgi:release factor glutamine methyltransferase
VPLYDRSFQAVLVRAAKRLREAGVENPRGEALSLLARTLRVGKVVVMAHLTRTLSAPNEARYLHLVDRRSRREPFAYLVGTREFYGLELEVDARVLIPRPETETLVDEAISILRDHARTVEGPSLVVDVGTGSGAIACAVATHDGTAHVVGADLSAGALVVANVNRRRLGLARRVGLVRGDLLNWLRRPADLILANLPYIPSERIAGLMPEVSRYEPRMALDGGPDGTDLVRRLVSQAAVLLRPGGSILLELDPDQVEPIKSVALDMDAAVLPDLAGDARVLRLDRVS